MNLQDGLNRFKQNPDEWKFTQSVEKAAQEVQSLLRLYGDEPTPVALASTHSLLIKIEEWKAMCLRDRMGNAASNSQRDVWNAFRGALDADNDHDAILSIMQLRGFGSSRDEESGQRRAKVATAVLRFLMPTTWGVVDWRTAAMLGLLRESQNDADRALQLAKGQNANELRDAFDIIDENGACEYNLMYRGKQTAAFPKAVDVEMAIFGLSLIAWPMPS